jgi:curved DNA-binding protein CbpA
LVISGSFGVENRSSTSELNGMKNVQNSVIGDVSVEYKIKDNFRVRAFNQSNNATVKQNSGPFTQGIGISYREEFDHWNELQFIQKALYVLNGKKEVDPPLDKRKRQAVTVPNSEMTTPESVEKIKKKI